MDKIVLWLIWGIAIILAAGMKIETSNKDNLSVKAFLLHFIPLLLIGGSANLYISELERNMLLYKGQVDHCSEIIATLRDRTNNLNSAIEISKAYSEKNTQEIKDAYKKQIDSLTNNYETKIQELQQRAVTAGLGDWEEIVVVPAKTEQVFKFKNEEDKQPLAEKPQPK